MGTSPPSTAIALISGMITPAFMILASASLVATALVRLGRVVDRVRIYGTAIQSGDIVGIAGSEAAMRRWLVRHDVRAMYAERAVALLFGAVAILVVACLSIAVDRAVGGMLTWLPVSLTILGMLGVLAGAAYMVAESRLGAAQVRDEIALARERLDPRPPVGAGAGIPA